MPSALATLQQQFGFSEFKPGQQEVIEHLLAGRSAAAVFPTGGGKSLCYQLPALLLPGLTLVVSPLIALMKDQIDALGARGIAARRLDSTLGLDEYRTVMDEVRSGRLRLLYVAPERFLNERFCETIRHTPISLFAVDEAHCISEWGHNFRSDYLRLAQFAELCKAERLLALTATATEAVLADMCRLFRIEPGCAVRTGFYRPNLTLLTTPTTVAKRDALFFDQLRRRPPGSTIVYVTLQRTAEELAARIAKAGLPARPYHAGMEDDDRAQVQDWFLAGRQAIVVATIAFGMGIDKPDIRYVYHYNPPKSLENYAQEIGRSGRDGQPAVCELFFCQEDLNVLENFAYGDTPAESGVAGLVNELFAAGADFDVSVQQLSTEYDIRLSVVRTLLTYLDLLGYLETGTPFYSSYQFQPLMPSTEILGKFQGERREFLARLFAQSQKRRTWFHIDVDEACRAIGEPRERAVRALDYLAEQRFLELQTAGVRHRFHLRRKPADLPTLTGKLYQRLLEREQREIGRLAQVAAWVAEDGCQVDALGAHFAELRDRRCGHCSWCLRQGTPLPVPDRPPVDIAANVWAKALSAREEYADQLAEPRAFARFLCGVSSPWLVRAKLQGHPLFGALGHVPFPALLARLT